jgi:ATP-dependent protease ClpP protease subunit
MKKITISGVIGWDVTAKEIRDQIESAPNEEIELHVSSPGGSVWEALAIFNAIRSHTSKVRAVVDSIAASAAAYIVAAANEVEVFDNSIFMLHNPWSCACGDYQDFAKESEYLKSTRDITAKGFADKSNKPIDEIQEMMDEETWLFGKEIIDQGFADILMDTSQDDQDQNEVMTLARMRVKACFDTMQKDQKKLQEYQQLILNYVNQSDINQSQTQQNVADEPIKKEITKMNAEQLKREHPEVYSEIFEKGVNEERERVQAHLNFVKAGIAKDHAIQAIDEGKDFNKVEQSFYMTESAKKVDLDNRQSDNPDPDIATPKDDISQKDQHKDLMASIKKFSSVQMRGE